MSQALGQSIVVENRAGAGGIVGTEAVARARPDGYQLLMTPNAPVSVLPVAKANMPYDVQRDLAPIGVIFRVPIVLMVGRDVPARNLAQFVALAKATAGGLSVGSAGNGSGAHLAIELFNAGTGAGLVHVPYRGTGPALNDLAAKVVDLYFGDPATLSVINAGSARALAVTSPRRWPLLPDTPAVAEAVPGYESENWYGLAAPPGVPAEIRAALHAAVLKVMRDPAVARRYDEAGLHPAVMELAEYDAFLRADSARWERVVRTGNIRIDG
jgi:tripartite-type tricarboxylate transporter receptor subunit TctC